MRVYNGFTGKTEIMPSSSTIAQMRQPGKYWVVSDAQLKRDLAGRTLADVYRDNHAGRIVDARDSDTHYSPPFSKYEPRWETETETGGGIGPTVRSYGGKPIIRSIRAEYLADCAARGHTPSPASLDANYEPLAMAA